MHVNAHLSLKANSTEMGKALFGSLSKKIKIKKILSQQQENGGHFNNGEDLTVNCVLELGQIEKRVFITKND